MISFRADAIKCAAQQFAKSVLYNLCVNCNKKYQHSTLYRYLDDLDTQIVPRRLVFVYKSSGFVIIFLR